MALATPTQTSAPVAYAMAHGMSAVMGSITTTTQSDHVDVLGYTGRVYIAAENGAANPVTFTVQGSHDATTWVTLVLEVDPSTFADITDVTVAAATDQIVFLNPAAIPRYLRINVTAANANGTAFTLCAER